MQKFAKIVMITLVGIILSFLLIETSTFLRKLFTEPPSSWHNNLTNTTTEFDISQPPLVQVKKDKTIFTTLASQPSAQSEKRYLRIKTETPLFKTTDDTNKSPSNILFMLPSSYFVKVIKEVTLESGDKGYYVRYSTYEGYASQSAFYGAMTDITTTQSGIKISLNKDAGSYLRQSPEITDDNKIVLIEKSTSGIILIAKTYGDTPSDGSTNEWYFVEYSKGPTTTYTGYIYAERCDLEKPLENLVLESDKTTSEEQNGSEILAGTTATTTESETTKDLALESNKLLWIVCVVFMIPVVLIFIMIVKKPKRIDYLEDGENIEGKFQDNFHFDEQISPQILKNDHKKLKFKSNNIENLSKFVKPNISLEISKEFSPGNQPEPDHSKGNDYYLITKTASPQTFHAKNQNQNINHTIEPTILENATPERQRKASENAITTSMQGLKSFWGEKEEDTFNGPQNHKSTWSFSKMIKKLKSKNTISKRISKNRARDAFHPGIIASDDYFEFADSFELTTPINNHYILGKTKPHSHLKRQGKRINSRH